MTHYLPTKKNFTTLLILLLFVGTGFSQNLELVWQDEFNYTGLPDPKKWGYDTGNGGWGNNEVQNYVANRTENTRVENGNLIIEARRDWHDGIEYSSGRLVTRGKGDWKYGRIEVRAKIPLGNGMWPAIWMLPTDWEYGGWPASGEIDIMENFAVGGIDPHGVHANIHTQSYNHMNGTNKGAHKGGLSNVEDNYHVYAVNWYEDRQEYQVDGQTYFTFYNEGNWQAWPFDKRFHLILNIAVGGNLGGWVNPNIFPKRMTVDYVRVYQDVPPADSYGPVTVFQNCDFGGYHGGLAPGEYTKLQLTALGIKTKDISSIQLEEGFKAVLYENDDFTGASTEITANSACLGDIGWNDRMTSIKILTNGVTDISGGFYLENRNSELFMDVTGGTGGTQNGVNIQQWNYTGATNQQFNFVHRENGSYSIKPVNSGKALDVGGFSLEDGGNILQWTDHQGINQQFIVVPTGDGYFKLVGKQSGKIVEVAGSSTAPEANVQQWKNNNQHTGQWKLIPINSVTGTGNGLRVNYFNGTEFETPVFTRIEETVDANWGTGSPNLAVNVNDFSARWTGQVEATQTGEHTFYITSDNGRRLWVNDQLIIDEWQNDFGIEYSGKIALTAGEKHDIRLDYFEGEGGASANLSWSTRFMPKEIVPKTQLYANDLPEATITAPANNASFDAGSDVSVAVTANDANGTVDRVELYHNDTLLASITAAPYAYTWSGLAPGEYTIKARVYDNLQAVAETSTTTFQIDDPANQLPEVTLTAPANNAAYETGETISLAATATDTDGTIAKVEFFNGTEFLGESTTEPYTFNWTGATQGQYELTAKATDNDGGVKTSSIITVTVSNPPNEFPTITFTSPITNSVFEEGETITLTATASDADGTITKVEFYHGATLLGAATEAPYTFEWTGVAPGTYSLAAKATDNMGAGKTSSIVVIEVVAVVNEAPRVSIVTPEHNAVLNTGSSVTLTATATDGDGSVAEVRFYQGTALLATVSSAPYAFTTDVLDDGIYNFTAQATDDKESVATSSAITVKVGEVAGMDDDHFGGLKLFPNPATSVLHVEAQINLDGTKVVIYDVCGVEVFSGSWSNASVDVSSLKPGLYLLKTVQGSKTAIYKFIKE